VQQWLGVIVGIAIALLLTLPLPFCVGHHSSCFSLCIMPLLWWLHCVLCHGIFAMQRDAVALLFESWHCSYKPWHCFLFHSVVHCAMALFFILWHCTLCCSILCHATVLGFVVWNYTSCWAFCFVLRTLHFVPQHWQWHFVLITAPCVCPLHHLEKQSTGGIGESVIGGILMPFNTALKNKKSTCTIGRSVSLVVAL